jgi:hypothetical protein
MGELVIRGLTLEQYAYYSAEAGMLRQKWEQSEGTLDIYNEMLQVLAKYGQDPRTCVDEDGNLNYNACGLIYEWHEAINNDPEMLVKYSQYCGNFTQKAMFGSSSATAEQTIEGISFETYAKTCALVQGKSEADMPAFLASLGYKDEDHYKRVSEGFNAAMAADTSFKMTTHFGELFAKYNAGFIAQGTQYSVDAVAEAMDDHEEMEKLQQTAIREVARLAASGQANGVVDYLKKTIPDVDEDSMEWYMGYALDLLAKAGNRDAARALLSVRYDVRGETDNKQEWINSELDILFL